MISERLMQIVKDIQIKLDNKFWSSNISEKEKILASCVKMSEEVGELSGEVLKTFWRAREEKLKNYSNDELKWEFADSILTILLLAEQMWIDINEALEVKLKKIENRGGI